MRPNQGERESFGQRQTPTGIESTVHGDDDDGDNGDEGTMMTQTGP